MQNLLSACPCPPFCILLAGGQGSRLHELTKFECKPAVPFGGGRLVDFTMANAVRSGLRQMLVATQYLPQALESHLERIWRPSFGCDLRIREGNGLQPGGYRGTADAVRANLPEIVASGAREVVVLSADHVYAMDYQPMIERHRAAGAKVTVAVDEVPLAQARSFGVLSASGAGQIHAFHEKPRHPQPAPLKPTMALVSLGIYVLDTAWLVQALRARGMDDFGHDILPEAVAQGVAQVHRAADEADAPFYWRDVGTLARYRLTQLDFIEPASAPCDAPLGAPRPSREALAAATQGTVLLPGARISARARVYNAILGRDAVVPEGAVIGEDPDEDRLWFRVVDDGTVLVTAPMLARQRDERSRMVAMNWNFARVVGQ